MLSLCIPVYNFDVRTLVFNLHQQAEQASIPYEILLIDDASDECFQAINQQIDLSNTRYIQLKDNIGRSKIRNLLAEESRYPYLIFMDCDSAVASDHYIKNYLPYCKPGIVCYGGRIYETQRPEKQKYLRWKYGVERESDYAEKRKKDPNFGFCTNNFLIDKDVLRLVGFNENLKGYGHEDTLFGVDLRAAGISIEHIDNQLIHIGLESSDVFIQKTKNGLKNLRQIENMIDSASMEIISRSKLISMRNRLKKNHLQQIFCLLFSLFQPFIKINLLSSHANLTLFDVYKLGYFCKLSKKSNR